MASTDPFYLAFDMSQSESVNHKQDLLRKIVSGLQSATGRFGDARMVLLTFGEWVHVAPATSLAELGQLSREYPWVGGRCRYASAFQELLQVIGASTGPRSSTGRPSPLVFFVTDHPDDSNWQPDFREFVRMVNPVLVPITYGFAERHAGEFMACPPDVGVHIPRQHDNIAQAVVAQVLQGIRGGDRVSGNHAAPEVGFGGGAHAASRTVEFRLPSGADPARPGAPAHARSADQPTVAMSTQAAVSSAGGRAAPARSAEVRGVGTVPKGGTAPPAAGDDPGPGPDSSARPDTSPPPPERAPTDVLTWTGKFTPFAVGEPGRSGEVLPLPDPDEWNRPDTVCDGVCFLGDQGMLVELRAASVRGSSHRYYGVVRQDEYRYRRTGDGNFLVCAVSDGVSSGKLSHRAAVFITQKGCELLAERLRDGGPERIDWTDLVTQLAAGVVSIGSTLIARERAGVAPEQVTPAEVVERMAATAVFAVVDLRPSADGIPVHLCSVGDSSAWVLRRGSTWEPQAEVKNEGKVIASSRTQALPILPREPLEPLETRLAPEDVLVLMTDGIGDPLGDGTGPVGRFLAAEWKRPPQALEFAAQVDFSRRSHDDDRTAVAVWPGRDR